MFQRPVKLWIACLLFIINSISYSLPSDKTALVNVQADSADISQSTHKGIYIGNVQFSQGSTNLHAAKASTQANEKNELILAIAEGDTNQQAHYWTKTAEDKPEMHAYADTIKYHAQTRIVDLLGNAKIIQGKNSFSAPIIHYDTIKQQVISQKNGNQPTNITFYPEKKKT